LKQLKFEIYQP